MYYYIFEQPNSVHERANFEKIRDIAREFSIQGENAQASPARSPEELVQIAIEKNYTTIVAVGDDSHVNKIVSAIINAKALYTVALGIISSDPNSILYERWGFKSAEEACETLKFRKLEKFTLGLVEPNHYFLSSARIECPNPTRIVLEVDHWKAEAIIDRLEISNNLYILLERYLQEKSIFKSAFNWLTGKEQSSADRSIFKGKIIKIKSDNPLPILIGNEVVSKTPANVYRKISALNIICKRDKVLAESAKVTEQVEKKENFWEQK
ncbi:MAG: hypothetical protein NTZ65_01405 [Candidatus Berkelbacteria bacterium]|nr:hypothetical protein [Candidatus Berkelbacteria bacterium]